MTEIYKMSRKVFLKNISLGVFISFLGVFGLIQIASDSGAMYYGFLLTAFGLLIIYFSILQKKKKLLEISPKGIVLREKVQLAWSEISGFNVRMVRIKNKDLPMIDVFMNDTWNPSLIGKGARLSARINSKTGFGEFSIPVNMFSVNENDLYDRLNTLLKLDEDNRVQYLSHNKYR